MQKISLRKNFLFAIVLLSSLITLLPFSSCQNKKPEPPQEKVESTVVQKTDTTTSSLFLDTLSERTFHFFWDLADDVSAQIPDRWPSKSFSSIAATGFGLTSYLVGVERGYITREQAAERVLKTLKFLNDAPKGKPWLISKERPLDYDTESEPAKEPTEEEKAQGYYSSTPGETSENESEHKKLINDGLHVIENPISQLITEKDN